MADSDKVVFAPYAHSASYINVIDGVYYPCFTYDLANRLIYTPDANTFVNNYIYTDYSRELIFKSDAMYPMPWHSEQETFLQHLHEFIDAADEKAKKSLLMVYPNYSPERSNKIFCISTIGIINEDKIMQIINTIDRKNVSDDIVSDAIEFLSYYGVTNIPVIDSYIPEYHQGISSEDSFMKNERITVKEHGWMSKNKVFKKSRVAKLQD